MQTAQPQPQQPNGAPPPNNNNSGAAGQQQPPPPFVIPVNLTREQVQSMVQVIPTLAR
jgi:hypothetical protein